MKSDLQKAQSCRVGNKWIPNNSLFPGTLLASYSIAQMQLDMRVTALANPAMLTVVWLHSWNVLSVSVFPQGSHTSAVIFHE